MSEADQLAKIQAGLAGWCKANGGKVHIAHDLDHLLLILNGAPKVPTIGLYVSGEKPRNAEMADVESRMDRTIWVVLMRGYELEQYPGKSLVDNYAGGKPLFDLLRAAKRAIHGLRFDADDEPIPYYHGYEQISIPGVKVDAYKLIFVICTEDGDDAGIEETDAP